MTDPMSTSDPFSDAPWDDNPSASLPAANVSFATRRLLRLSLVVLISSTVVMFLAAVASNNVTPSSPQERFALGIHRTSMFGMLLGFIGILLSQRLPALAAYLNAKRESASLGRAQRSTPAAEFWGLIWACMILLIWVWGSVYIGIAILHVITYWLLIVVAALLANMIILHTGTLRSFAVGMLVSLLMILFTWRFLGSIAILYGDGFGMGRGGAADTWVYVTFGIEVSVAVLAGLLCAAYHELLGSMRSRPADSSVTPPGD